MNVNIVIASVVITLALVFYSIGVLGEKKSESLRPKHLIFFLAGLVCDSVGTAIMSSVAQASGAASSSALHFITGSVALGLMAIHAIWAIIVLLSKKEKLAKSFHKLSVVVWTFWLIPYICGIFVGVPAIELSDTASVLLSVVISLVVGWFVAGKDFFAKRAAH